MQQFAYLRNGIECCAQLPPVDAELLPGVPWGDPCTLFTPAYWYAQYLMRGTEANRVGSHRIGATLAEEITACILGGHGIPAEIGLAAFQRLREEGLIAELCTDEKLLQDRLREPLWRDTRPVRYRFWRQKAVYLAAAFRKMRSQELATNDAIQLRDNLMALPGVGPKTASWIVRNWLGSDEVAILDIHIVRAGILAELFSATTNVSKDYIEMETRFVGFSRALGVPTSSLDALIWQTMRTTPRLVTRLLEQFHPLDRAQPSNQATPDQSPAP